MKKSWNFLHNWVLFGPFSLGVPLSKIIPKSLVTLQFLKCLIVQIKAYIQGFQMMYKPFLILGIFRVTADFPSLWNSLAGLFFPPLYFVNQTMLSTLILNLPSSLSCPSVAWWLQIHIDQTLQMRYTTSLNSQWFQKYQTSNLNDQKKPPFQY